MFVYMFFAHCKNGRAVPGLLDPLRQIDSKRPDHRTLLAGDAEKNADNQCEGWLRQAWLRAQSQFQEQGISFGGTQKGDFQKGGLGGCSPERKPERGYVRMFPRNKNRNGGTFGCSPGTKTGTRVHSPKPPFYETALLSPGDF